MDEEAVLVDQPAPHQRRGQRGTTDGQVKPRLRLESCDLFRRFVADQPAVPVDPKALDSRASSLKNECNSSSTCTQSSERLAVSTKPSSETDIE